MTRFNDNAVRKESFEDGLEAPSYVLRGGDDGAQRLRLLARAMQPRTHALLARVGIYRGMRCLDVGCGSGEVTLQIARMVAPEGHVFGIDADRAVFTRARAEAARQQWPARFEVLNAEDLLEESVYDCAHTRFLLAHLRQPEHVLERMMCALRPGGTIVAEDVDFPGHVSYPPCAAFDRYLELYQAVVLRRGGDPTIGRRLPSLLRHAGAEDLSIEVVQPTFCDGEGKFVAAVTMEHIRGAVVRAGFASHAEVDALVSELEAFASDPDTLISLPRIFQVWGRKPTS